MTNEITGHVLVIGAAMKGEAVSVPDLRDAFLFLANSSTADILAEMGRQERTLRFDETKRERRLSDVAPELLAACKLVQRYFDDLGPVLGESDAAHNERMVRMALQDAIAKAEG